MHIPNPGDDPGINDPDRDKPQPPVPPDQQPDVVPVQEPPKPGRGDDAPPMIVRATITVR